MATPGQIRLESRVDALEAKIEFLEGTLNKTLREVIGLLENQNEENITEHGKEQGDERPDEAEADDPAGLDEPNIDNTGYNAESGPVIDREDMEQDPSDEETGEHDSEVQ